MNTTSRIVFGLIIGMLALAAAVFGTAPQPIEFNHNLHITDVGLDCGECHVFVTTNRKATLPDQTICAECHEEPQGESAEEQKLVALLQGNSDLDWQRVYVLPEHVYFSHLRHVTLGQIGCQDCHGQMHLMTSPPKKPATDILDMDYCMDCHDERQVNNDCLACHN